MGSAGAEVTVAHAVSRVPATPIIDLNQVMVNCKYSRKLNTRFRLSCLLTEMLKECIAINYGC